MDKELDTVGRFSDRAADYVRYRPTYPAEAIDAILEGLGPPERLVAVCPRLAGKVGSMCTEDVARSLGALLFNRSNP